MVSHALLRHAKSSWDASDLEDFDRPLNARGRTAAPVMGEALREFPFAPEVILCSPAKRTRETLHLIDPNLSKPRDDVQFDHQLYLTNAETLLERLRHVPPAAKTVLMVGHNPGLHELALLLAGRGDAKSISRLEDKFPTASLAILTFPETAWRDVGPSSGYLEGFMTPRDRS